MAPSTSARGANASPCHLLTAREKQVLKLIAEGRRNRDIAKDLFVSVKTVEKHRANLMAKLNLHTAAALMAFAIQNTILTE
jgi:DNA-binding NarL/FixJ family response regulator